MVHRKTSFPHSTLIKQNVIVTPNYQIEMALMQVLAIHHGKRKELERYLFGIYRPIVKQLNVKPSLT